MMIEMHDRDFIGDPRTDWSRVPDRDPANMTPLRASVIPVARRPFMLALAGYARVGKDHVANFLSERFGMSHTSVGQPIKDSLYALNPIVCVEDGRVLRVRDIVDKWGWEEAKDRYPEIVELLQRLGNEASREVIGTDVWVKAAIANAGTDAVFSSVRFQNEARAIQAAGGYIIRINRPGFGPRNDHVSEIDMDEYAYDRVIENDGTLADLEHKVVRLHRYLSSAHRIAA